MAKVQNARMQWIEALRGYGALLVVLTHVVASFVWKGWVIDSAITDYLANGGRAVQLFFIISGFVVFMSLDKKQIHEKHDYLVYVFKRYITIFSLRSCLSQILFRLTRYPAMQRWLSAM